MVLALSLPSHLLTWVERPLGVRDRCDGAGMGPRKLWAGQEGSRIQEGRQGPGQPVRGGA